MPATSTVVHRQPMLVLVHGAGMGAWVWERVIHNLSIPAIALDVPGRKSGASPNGCADELIVELDRRGVEAVVLVLHSLAGVLAPALAARLGARLIRCVFVASVIAPIGGAFVDALSFANRLILRLLFTFNPKGLKPSPGMIRGELYNDLTEQDVHLVVSLYAAEFPGLYLTAVGTPLISSQCGYVKLLKDKSMLPAQQDRMIARLGNPRVHEIDAGHLAMLSEPAALARVLLQEYLA